MVSRTLGEVETAHVNTTYGVVVFQTKVLSACASHPHLFDVQAHIVHNGKWEDISPFS